MSDGSFIVELAPPIEVVTAVDRVELGGEVRTLPGPVFVRGFVPQFAMQVNGPNGTPYLTIGTDGVLRLGPGVTCEEAAAKFVELVNQTMGHP